MAIFKDHYRAIWRKVGKIFLCQHLKTRDKCLSVALLDRLSVGSVLSVSAISTHHRNEGLSYTERYAKRNICKAEKQGKDDAYYERSDLIEHKCFDCGTVEAVFLLYLHGLNVFEADVQ